MKYIISAILVGLITISSLSAININIKLEGEYRFIKLYKIEYGKTVLLKEYKEISDTKLSYHDNNRDGIYCLYTPQYGYKRIYSKNNDLVKVSMTEKAFKIINPTKENKILEKWSVLSDNVRSRSSEYFRSKTEEIVKQDVFYNEMRKLEKQIPKFLSSTKLKNESFNKVFNLIVKSDIDYFKLSYIHSPLVSASIKNLPEDLYGTIVTENKFQDSELLKCFHNTIEYLYYYVGLAQKLDIKSKGTIKRGVDYLSDDKIKVEYLLFKGGNDNDYGKLERTVESNKKYFNSPYAKERYNTEIAKFQNLKVGAKGYNFTLEDKNGKMVSFNSFRGKVVVIDLWATTCGPCCKLRPSFEKVAEEMKGEDIVFISISSDKHKSRWLKYIKDSHGIELIDPKRNFGNYYKVSSIPRFFIFDKNGRIVNLNAPAPRLEEFKKEIESVLKK